MRRFFILAILGACVPTAALAQSDAPVPTATTAAAAASPTPSAVSQADERRVSGLHFVARGRKAASPFGYMKQANDDPQGLSRIQDQVRQLRPQL